MQEVLQTVAAVAEKSINVVVSDRRKGDLPNVVSDNRQIVETLNWTPAHNDLEQIVSHALAWEKQQSDRIRVNR